MTDVGTHYGPDLLAAVRAGFDSVAFRNRGIQLDELRLEGELPTADVVMIARSEKRPGCRLGFRWDITPDVFDGEPPESFADAPGALAVMMTGNFLEALADWLREHDEPCRVDTIVWL